VSMTISPVLVGHRITTRLDNTLSSNSTMIPDPFKRMGLC